MVVDEHTFIIGGNMKTDSMKFLCFAILILVVTCEAYGISEEDDFKIKKNLSIGWPSPHGLLMDFTFSIESEQLNGFKPFVGVDWNYLNGFQRFAFGYVSGIEYGLQLPVKFRPNLILSSFLVFGGGTRILRGGWDESSQSHDPPLPSNAFLIGAWLDLLKSDRYDLNIGTSFGLANVIQFQILNESPYEDLSFWEPWTFTTKPDWSLTIRFD